MTSHALARKLLAGPDAPVHIAYPYGDFWRSTAAPQVERVEEGRITDSTSLNMPRVVTEDDERRAGDEDDTNFRTVILIK
jgi:hypothetical protein